MLKFAFNYFNLDYKKFVYKKKKYYRKKDIISSDCFFCLLQNAPLPRFFRERLFLLFLPNNFLALFATLV